MTDLNWCTFCDNAISPYSESLYCSEQCLRSDALRNHPLLGYTYPEFIDFPRPTTNRHERATSRSSISVSSISTSPSLTATITTTSSITTTTSSSSSSIHNYYSSSSFPSKFDFLSSSSTMKSLPPVTSIITAKPFHATISTTTIHY
ncbi:MAG: hypothetical protein EXX96DRAFT_513635 [Benjaminiella poitrasii]|nr:MAG: hypothetical protein EXX96DRAFT_513635 [Benjaminiella poitrasii]